jgi:hypothetical protein
MAKAGSSWFQTKSTPSKSKGMRLILRSLIVHSYMARPNCTLHSCGGP